MFLGIIVSVEDDHFEKVKNRLLEEIKNLSDDDRVYLFRKNSTLLPEYLGQSVGHVANYQNSKFPCRLSKALDQTICSLCEEDVHDDEDKHIFLIFDKQFPFMEHELTRGIKVDDQLDCSGEGSCNFHLVNLTGEDFVFDHPRCEVVGFNDNILRS